MWAAALKTYEDEFTRYVFFPELLTMTPPAKIQADLVKHRLALQPNKHTLIWTTIAGHCTSIIMMILAKLSPRQIRCRSAHQTASSNTSASAFRIYRPQALELLAIYLVALYDVGISKLARDFHYSRHACYSKQRAIRLGSCRSLSSPG